MDVEIEIDSIRNNSDEAKSEFISRVIKQTGIPANFVPIARSNVMKKIYEIKDDGSHKREWLFFLNNKFYCIYCLCFSPLDENRLVKGIEYVKNCRAIDILNNHGKETNHQTAKNAYLRSTNTYDGGGGDTRRNALKCIVKIIIYIATHG